MKKAIEFAKEILRKKDAIKATNSKYLKTDYEKSVNEDLKELKYYCTNKGLDLTEVLKLAAEQEDDRKDIEKKLKEALE